MPPENERRTRDADHHPLERAVDKNGVSGKFNRLNAKIAEYRALVYLAVGIALFLGWRFEGPGARLNVVEAQVDTLKVGQKKTHSALEVLVRLNCFDSTTSFREKRLAGLDCSDIERARRSAADSTASSIETERPEVAARVVTPLFGNSLIPIAHAQERKR